LRYDTAQAVHEDGAKRNPNGSMVDGDEWKDVRVAYSELVKNMQAYVAGMFPEVDCITCLRINCRII